MEFSYYVFKFLIKLKLGYKFVFINKFISYLIVREYFKSSFKDIVLDIVVFSIYFLRVGGVFVVVNVGVVDRLF